MINEDWFSTGGEDGSLSLWFAMKKKPAVCVPAAHGYSAAGTPRWITAIGCLKQSDLVVSGSNDGAIRLWRADVEERSLQQVRFIYRCKKSPTLIASDSSPKAGGHFFFHPPVHG